MVIPELVHLFQFPSSWCFLLFPRGALQVSNAYGITKAWKFQRDDWGGNGPGPQFFQWDFIDVQ